MKNRLIMGVATGFALLAFAGGASAVMTAEDLEAKKAERDVKQEEIQSNKDARQLEIDEKKSDIQERRCEQIKERVRNRTLKFNGSNEYHQLPFQLFQGILSSVQ